MAVLETVAIRGRQIGRSPFSVTSQPVDGRSRTFGTGRSRRQTDSAGSAAGHASPGNIGHDERLGAESPGDLEASCVSQSATAAGER